MSEEQKTPKKRGFAAMDRAEVAKISRKGGLATHAAGNGHRFTAEEAQAAGKKGGLAPHVSGRPRPSKVPELGILPDDVPVEHLGTGRLDD